MRKSLHWSKILMNSYYIFIAIFVIGFAFFTNQSTLAIIFYVFIGTVLLFLSLTHIIFSLKNERVSDISYSEFRHMLQDIKKYRPDWLEDEPIKKK